MIGRICRTGSLQYEQIALCETGLNRCDVDRLQELRLEEFTDPGDLVSRQGSVGVGQQPVGRIVARIRIDRIPAFD